MKIQPMKATDWNEKKLQFPMFIQPKIDGVRGLNLEGRLTGRTLKEHANRHTTRIFSQEILRGFDGELICGNEWDDDLCRKTTSALSTIDGEPNIRWVVFDIAVPNVPYHERLAELARRVDSLHNSSHPIGKRIDLIRTDTVRDMASLEEIEAQYLDMGYEGVILRAPESFYKSGRSTVTKGELLRVKRFVEEEAYVVEIIEGEENLNEAKVNALGHTERSTKQENMVPNGMVGAMICRDVKTGKDIRVAAGKMTHDMRKLYFEQQHLLIGKTIKYKYFPRGIKDAPRFPTFQSLRMNSDM